VREKDASFPLFMWKNIFPAEHFTGMHELPPVDGSCKEKGGGTAGIYPGRNAVDTVPGNGTGHGDVPEILRIGGNGRCVFA
jgi:hypothetical protein